MEPRGVKSNYFGEDLIEMNRFYHNILQHLDLMKEPVSTLCQLIISTNFKA